MRRATGQRREAGFTLMEVLLAAGIVVTLTTLLWGSFSQSLRIKRRTEELQDRYHVIHMAMERIARDLSLAYLSSNEMPGAVDRRTYFTYVPGLESRFAFSYMGHQHLYRDAREGDTAIISYFVARDPEDPRRTHLWRRETRRLVRFQELPEAVGELYILCPDVEEMRALFYDERTEEWRDEWNTTTADGQPDRLPKRVRVMIRVKAEQENQDPETFITEAKLHLDEPVDGRPN